MLQTTVQHVKNLYNEFIMLHIALLYSCVYSLHCKLASGQSQRLGPSHHIDGYRRVPFVVQTNTKYVNVHNGIYLKKPFLNARISVNVFIARFYILNKWGGYRLTKSNGV
jgi:hypothetical protein